MAQMTPEHLDELLRAIFSGDAHSDYETESLDGFGDWTNSYVVVGKDDQYFQLNVTATVMELFAVSDEDYDKAMDEVKARIENEKRKKVMSDENTEKLINAIFNPETVLEDEVFPHADTLRQVSTNKNKAISQYLSHLKELMYDAADAYENKISVLCVSGEIDQLPQGLSFENDITPILLDFGYRVRRSADHNNEFEYVIEW